MAGASRSLGVSVLRARGLRNLEDVALSLGESKKTIFFGDNGDGKTSVLEGIYAAATTKSFRSVRLQELVQWGQAGLDLSVTFVERGDDDAGCITRTHALAFFSGERRSSVDGAALSTMADFATRSPVVSFVAADLELASGPASGRRKLLDRVALYLHADLLVTRRRYERASKERFALLEARSSDPSLDVYEQMLVESGCRWMEYRAEAAAVLAEAVGGFFSDLSGGASLALAYRPGAPQSPEEFLAGLCNARGKDRARGRQGLGPQRDELELRLEGKLARTFASQGQTRMIAISLKLAEADAITRARAVRPLILLDDISSELDEARTAALFQHLETTAGQIVVSTTRPELIPGAGNAQTFRVRLGRISPAPVS